MSSSGPSALGVERRGELVVAKLAALVRSRWGAAADGARSRSFEGGAALVGAQHCWAYLDPPASERFGAALSLGIASGRGTAIDILSEDASPAAAQMAELFCDPPRVWRISGRELEPLAATGPSQGQAAVAADLARETEASILEAIAAAGAMPVRRDGTLVAEVLGLEVARVVEDDSGPYLALGVGRHDRAGHEELHGGRPPLSGLASVVESVRKHRRPGAPAHPANRLCTERWLRAVALEHPEMVGERSLRVVEHPLLAARLGGRCPALALGGEGDPPTAYAFSAGVDLEAVPKAALAARQIAPEARLVVVLPEGDDVPLLRAMVAHLRTRAEVAVVPRSWASFGEAEEMLG